ncbi:hypothetical protein Aperf_G00000098695 [Anoplocephala perfoliata]
MAGFHENADFPAVPSIFRTTFEFRFRPTSNSARNPCVMTDAFELPPPPSPLATDDDEFYRESALKSPSTANHNQARQSDNYKDDNTFSSKLPSGANIQILDESHYNNAQVLLNSSLAGNEESVEPDLETIMGHLDSTMSDLRSFQVFNGDQEQYAFEYKKPSAENNHVRLSKKLVSGPRNNYFTKPRKLPRHGRNVYLDCGSTSLDNNPKVPHRDTQFKAFQNGDVSGNISPLSLNSKSNLNYQECEVNNGDQDITSFDHSGEEIFCPYEKFRFAQSNFSKHSNAPHKKVHVRRDKVHLTERATSPVIFSEELGEYNCKDNRNHESPVDTTGDRVHNKSAGTFPKDVAQTTSTKDSPSSQESMIVVVATPPSPVLVCSVMKNNSTSHPLQKTPSSKIIGPPKYHTSFQSPLLDGQKPVAFATVSASESVDYSNKANVVFIEGMTPLSPCPLPTFQSPQSPRFPCPPTLATHQKGCPAAAHKNPLRNKRRMPISYTRPTDIHNITPTISPEYDRTLSNRELVSSVSSGHRPFRSRKSSSTSISSKSSGSCDSESHCSSYHMSGDCQALDEKQLHPFLDKLTSVESRPLLTNAVQGTLGKGPPTLTPHRSPAKHSSPLEARAIETPLSSESKSADEDPLGCIPNGYPRQVVQEWLVNRVSANVTAYFGNELVHMLRKASSLDSATNKKSNHETEERTSARSALKKSSANSEIPVLEIDKKGGQSQVKLEQLESSDPASKTKQTLEKSGPGRSAMTFEPNQKLAVNRSSTNDQRITTQRKQVLAKAQQQQQQRPGPRIRIQPLSKPEEHSGGSDKGHHQPASTSPYSFEQIIEIDPRDDLVHSHKNPRDRRIKAASMKTGCYLNLKGPLKLPSLDGTLRRDREIYELIIGAPSKEKADRCVNYLRETFPRTVLQRKATRALFR